MGRKEKEGSDTLDAIASARTVPSGKIDPLASADTVLAGNAPVSMPRLPHEGGEVLGNRYEILAELGRGGEGVVYRARDLKADTIVALKLLQHDEGSKSRLQRFRRELQMARKVTHPNVVRIHDLIELPGRFGLSMELVEGEALDERIERAPLGSTELVHLAVDLARALAAAHEAGVTHRDLKPANVLLRARDGHAVVTDFGVSRAHGMTESAPPPAGDLTPLNLTREGMIVGTPQYMAPEQLEGSLDIGPAADVYAFGLLMVEAATRERLHAATTFAELRRRRSEEKPVPLREKRPELPRRLCDAVDRALSVAPGDRFRDGGELLAFLEPLVSRSAGPSLRVWGAVAGVAVTAVGVGAFAFSRHSPSASPPASAVGAGAAGSPSTPPLVLHASNLRRLTTGDGCEEFPHFTPDGRGIVYDGTVGRNAYVYEIDAASGGEPRQVTQVQGWDIAPSVSPDGKQVAFVRFEGEKVGAHVARLDGSGPARMVVKGSVRPSWTRDGRGIWAGTGTPISAYDWQSGDRLRALTEGPSVHTAQTVELEDGSVVAVMALDQAVERTAGLALFSPRGEMKWLFRGDVDEVLAVTADRRHALIAQTRGATHVELMDFPLDGSPGSSLAASGISARKGLSLSPDDRRIVWSACVEVPQIVAFDAAGKMRRAVDNDVPEPSSLTAVPGTRQVAVISTRSGKAEPWILGMSTDALPQPVPVGTLSVREIGVSHDGARFVVGVPGDGLYVGTLAGQQPVRRLTSSGDDSAPSFDAHDARVLFTRHPTGGRSRVMTVPFTGGDATVLLPDDSDWAAASPVDGRVAYLDGVSLADSIVRIWDGHASRALSAELPAGRYGPPRFSPDGKRIALVRGDTDLLEVDAATGSILRTISTPTGDLLSTPAYTSDGLVAIRVRFQGNLWMADLAP